MRTTAQLRRRPRAQRSGFPAEGAGIADDQSPGSVGPGCVIQGSPVTLHYKPPQAVARTKIVPVGETLPVVDRGASSDGFSGCAGGDGADARGGCREEQSEAQPASVTRRVRPGFGWRGAGARSGRTPTQQGGPPAAARCGRGRTTGACGGGRTREVLSGRVGTWPSSLSVAATRLVARSIITLAPGG